MKSRRAARGSAHSEAATARPAASTLAGWWALVAAAIAAALAFPAYVFPFHLDRAYVALRYADRILQGHGLTWTGGERIEGYSSLLWVLATAGVGSLGVDLVRASWMLGIASAVATVVAVLWRRRVAELADLVPGAFAALAIGCSGPLAAWSISGFEATMVAALLAWSIALVLPLLDRDEIAWTALIPAGMMLSLLTIARPEGVVFGIAAAAGLWAAGRSRREIGALLAWPGAALVAHSLFRVAYHGNLLPSTVREQLDLGPGRLLGGAIYVVDAIPTVAPIVLVAVAAVWWARRRVSAPEAAAAPATEDRGAMRFLLVMLGGWLACVILMGGDDLPARRFMLPALVVLAFLAARALTLARERGVSGPRLALLAAVALAIYVPLQILDPAMRGVHAGDVELEEAQAVGRMLGSGFRSMRPRIAVEQPGAIPYFSRLPAIDMAGTNDSHLASLPRGSVRELTPGDGTIGEYLMSREPDLVLFRNPAGGDTAYYRGGLEMRAHPRFLERYAIVNFQTPEPYKTRSRIWMRRDGGPLGIEISDSRIVIPGWHISADPASTVRLDDLGNAGVTIRPERVTGVTGITLSPGVWVVSIEASLPGVNVWIRDSATEAVLAQAPDRVGIRYGGGTVDIALQSDLDALVIVRRMVIERRE